MNNSHFEYSEIEIKSLDWWNSLDGMQMSKYLDEYYINNKSGLNSQELVNLYKKEKGIVDTTKRKRERFKIKK